MIMCIHTNIFKLQKKKKDLKNKSIDVLRNGTKIEHAWKN